LDDSQTQGEVNVPTPVLIGITVAVLRTDQIAAAVPDDFALVLRLHSLRVPEHLEGLSMPEEVIGPETHVEGGDLPDAEVPGHLAVGTHPFRVLGGPLDLYVSMGTVFRQEAAIGLDAERDIPIDLDPVPTPETVQLRPHPHPRRRP
jgi:hypothetical protein